jgi:mycoredoxin
MATTDPQHDATAGITQSSSTTSSSVRSSATAGVASEIVVYGTPWCGDCHRARRVFAQLAVAYRYVDIEHDEAASHLVLRLIAGMRRVPTITFPDGSTLVEPRTVELEARLAPFVPA